MIPFHRRSFLLMLACLGLCAFALGCEEDVAAWEPVDHPFEFYGLLNPTADTQFVRVFPLDVHLRSSSPEIDAVVTSVDVETGEEIRWRDSLLTFEDGTHGYLYHARFQPRAGRHRIQVTRSDAEQSTAAVDVPLAPEIAPPQVEPRVLQRVYFGGPDVQVHQLEVSYLVYTYWCGDRLHGFTYDFIDEVRQEGGRQFIELDLEAAYDRVRYDLMEKDRWYWVPEHGLVFLSLEVSVHVTDGGWKPPGGVFDPEVLMAPNVMTNVENGFGFVGSGYRAQQLVSLPDDVIQATRFLVTPAMDSMPENCHLYPLPPD